MAVGLVDGIWLTIAGVVAGAVGTAGGITSLVSYPALLAVGVAPVPADIANLVAVVAGWPSAALASRVELAGRARVLARTLPMAALGGAAGSVLLLRTPPGVFLRVVPFLVLAGSAALLAQPTLTARRARKPAAGRATLLTWTGVLSIYGGYFGAGSGIMLLAVLLVLLDPRLPRANAIKNMLIAAAALASAAVFIIAGPILWSAVAPLAGGLVIGSLLGPAAVRRIPPAIIRWGAATLGVILAIDLWVRPG